MSTVAIFYTLTSSFTVSYSDRHRPFFFFNGLVSSLTISLPKLCWFKILCTDSRTLCKAGATNFHYNFFFDFSKNHSMKFNCMVANSGDNCPVKILVFFYQSCHPVERHEGHCVSQHLNFPKIYISTWPRYYRKSYSFSVRPIFFCQRAESKGALSQLRCSRFITPTADLDRLATSSGLWA